MTDSLDNSEPLTPHLSKDEWGAALKLAKVWDMPLVSAGSLSISTLRAHELRST